MGNINMIKVYINGRFLLQKVTGEQRYAIEMVKELDKLVNENETWELLVPTGDVVTQLNLSNISIRRVGHLKGHLWEQIELPIFSRAGLLINFCDMAPMIKKNQVVFIHDMAIMAHPEYYTRKFRLWHEAVYRRNVNKVKKIYTVSNFSKNEIVKYLHVSQDRVEVINCACPPHLKSDVFLNEFIEKWKIDRDKKILLAVSSLSPNKNFKSIVESIKYLKTKPIELIIAGGSNTSEFKSTIDTYIDDVKYVGYVSDEELSTLYKIADCFVYPSFYEGFGIPPLEAMANGCAAVVSNMTALPEVCGDATLYCNPSNPADIAEKVDQVLQDKNLRDLLIDNGMKVVKSYSWKNSAKRLKRDVNKFIW